MSHAAKPFHERPPGPKMQMQSKWKETRKIVNKNHVERTYLKKKRNEKYDAFSGFRRNLKALFSESYSPNPRES